MIFADTFDPPFANLRSAGVPLSGHQMVGGMAIHAVRLQAAARRYTTPWTNRIRVSGARLRIWRTVLVDIALCIHTEVDIGIFGMGFWAPGADL